MLREYRQVKMKEKIKRNKPVPAKCKRQGTAGKKIKTIKKKKYKLKSSVKIFLWNIALIFTIIFCILFFVRVNSVTVVGNSKYSDSDIIDSSGIKSHDRLFLCKMSDAEKSIMDKFPYIDCVKVKRRFPFEILISVQIGEPGLAIHFYDGYAIISKRDRIIEIANEPVSQILSIKGVELFSYKEGSNVVFKNSNDKQLMYDIIKAIEVNGLCGIKSIDISDKEFINFNYDGRIDIFIGNMDGIDYKILTAREILETKIGPKEKGALNVTGVEKDNRSYFTPDYIKK